MISIESRQPESEHPSGFLASSFLSFFLSGASKPQQKANHQKKKEEKEKRKRKRKRKRRKRNYSISRRPFVRIWIRNRGEKSQRAAHMREL